jgi:hypothetical protein
MSHGHDHKDLLLDALRMMWKNAATTPGAHVGSETLRQEAGIPAVGAEEKGVVVVGACRSSCCCW